MSAHTGTLTAKTRRQSHADSVPPSSGPAAEATAPPAAQTPSARARLRASGNASRISVIDEGSISAAVAPCAHRAATSVSTDGASAHSRDATPKSVIPAT